MFDVVDDENALLYFIANYSLYQAIEVPTKRKSPHVVTEKIGNKDPRVTRRTRSGAPLLAIKDVSADSSSMAQSSHVAIGSEAAEKTDSVMEPTCDSVVDRGKSKRSLESMELGSDYVPCDQQSKTVVTETATADLSYSGNTAKPGIVCDFNLQKSTEALGIAGLSSTCKDATGDSGVKASSESNVCVKGVESSSLKLSSEEAMEVETSPVQSQTISKSTDNTNLKAKNSDELLINVGDDENSPQKDNTSEKLAHCETPSSRTLSAHVSPNTLQFYEETGGQITPPLFNTSDISMNPDDSNMDVTSDQMSVANSVFEAIMKQKSGAGISSVQCTSPEPLDFPKDFRTIRHKVKEKTYLKVVGYLYCIHILLP